jgi:hypothetical protein
VLHAVDVYAGRIERHVRDARDVDRMSERDHRLGCRSFDMVLDSICRMRSRVTP